MDWIEISITADGEAAEAVSELFNRLNSRPDGQGGAVTEVTGFDPIGEAHQPVVCVRTYLPADAADSPEQQRRLEEGLWYLGRIYPLGEPQVRRLAEADWANTWKAHYHPLRVGGRFLIVPAWLWPAGDIGAGAQAAPGDLVRPGPDDLPVVLDPGMAFGTGLHPSTQLCLALMEDIVQRGYRVLDAGCGSGILSIAAARLGAGQIDAFDIDPIAVQATNENSALNDLPVSIRTFASSGPGDGPYWGDAAPQSFDVIFVNILLPVILELLERDLPRYLAIGGRMILAGVIAEQEPQLNEALARRQMAVLKKLHQGDWVGFVVARAQ